MATRAGYVQGRGGEDPQVVLSVQPPCRGIPVSFQRQYLCTPFGALHLIQLAVSLLCLVLVCASSGSAPYCVLGLPLNTHIRALLFTCVFCALLCLLLLVLNLATLLPLFPINWDLFELVTFSVMLVLYVCTGAMVGSAVRYYSSEHLSHITAHTKHTLATAAVVGVVCGILCAASALLALRSLRTSRTSKNLQLQFPLPRSTSQTSQDMSHDAPDTAALPL